jgi:hypothetical protein
MPIKVETLKKLGKSTYWGTTMIFNEVKNESL